MQKKLVAYHMNHNVTIKCCLALFFACQSFSYLEF